MPPSSSSSSSSSQEAIHHHHDQGGLRRRRRAVPIVGKHARGQPGSAPLRARTDPPGPCPSFSVVPTGPLPVPCPSSSSSVANGRPSDRSRHVLGRLLRFPRLSQDKVGLLDTSPPMQGREPTLAHRRRCRIRIRQRLPPSPPPWVGSRRRRRRPPPPPRCSQPGASCSPGRRHHPAHRPLDRLSPHKRQP
jgi:hypothetical protein